MKTKLRLASMFFLVAGTLMSVHGQTVPDKTFKKIDKDSFILFDARAGITYANQKDNFEYSPGGGSSSANPLLGFYLGIAGEIPFTTKLSALAGLDFSLKGSKFGSLPVKRRFSYLDLPFQVKYSVNPKLHFSGGFQPSFLLGAKRIADDRTDDIADQYKSFDLAAIIGARYDFSEEFGIQLQYDHGLVNIFENVSSGEYVRNRVWRLGIRYRIKSW